MTHWKTTIAGICAFAVGGATAMKWITPEQGAAITGAIMALLGVLAADASKV